MITAVDTNVLIDVFTADPVFAERSAAALEESIRRGRIVVCEAVWAETCALFPDDRSFVRAMQDLGVELSPMTEVSAQQAGSAWRQYRKNKGSRTRMIADFMIAAHAHSQCDCLLTRDRGFYRQYFSTLKVKDPSV